MLRAIRRPTIDHRGPEFAALLGGIRERLGRVFQTRHPVALYPSSGTGMWEAALVNTLSPGDRVLMVGTGYFAALWRDVAAGVGLEVEWIPGDWRRGADAAEIEERLNADSDHSIKAVAIVHNETSTGATSDLAASRAAMDRAGHPALLLADTISSLASIDYRHDEWRVDVGVCCSQKGLMLPPGLGLLALSPKALAVSEEAGCPRSYWDWRPVLQAHERGFFPYTPPTNLLYGLDEALDMLLEEGLDEVLARHRLFAAATRRAVEEWGLEICCIVPGERSDSLTAVVLPRGTTPTPCERPFSSASTCRSAPGSAGWPAVSSASDTWGR